MTVFDVDVRAARDRFEQQGWLHLRSALAPEFLAYAQEHVARLAAAQDPLQGAAIKGAKEQWVFPFPGDVDVQEDVHGVVAAVTGLDPSRTVLSERHVKAYTPAPTRGRSRTRTGSPRRCRSVSRCRSAPIRTSCCGRPTSGPSTST